MYEKIEFLFLVMQYEYRAQASRDYTSATSVRGT
jgi:hypothetical protein